jgi:SAM-dependent methyltransferase
VFTRKFRRHVRQAMESVSGPGSDLRQTQAIRARLPQLLQSLNVRSLLDVPCGDFHWMRLVETDADYVGADIVAELIERNQRAYGSERRRFICIDLCRDALPRADLVLCRDCLVHLPNRDVARALANIRQSGATYLLTTTFVERAGNPDIATGKWRPLNLQRPPFDLPAPLDLIDECHPSAEYRDKRLALWRLDAVP